ncbi:MAG: hypothetical protein V3S45_08665 [Kiloniellales bacterium]
MLRSRNPLALATRRLGRRVKPSAKVYRRRPKHPEDGPKDSGGEEG